MDIEEFAPDMGPAAGLDNPTADEQLIEPGIPVSVNDAACAGPLTSTALSVGLSMSESLARTPDAATVKTLSSFTLKLSLPAMT